MWLSTYGYLKQDGSNLRIVLNHDFCKYYIWLFNRAHYYTIRLTAPKHSSHITIINEKIHGVHYFVPVHHLMNTRVDFEYNIEGNLGGFNKGFKNFWFPVKCDRIEEIKEILGIKEKEGYWGPHITIGNTKNEKQLTFTKN